MRRQPHRLILRGAVPGVVLSFWTAQGVCIAKNAADAERDGRAQDARHFWSIARDTSPADPATKTYCDQRAAEPISKETV